MLPRVRPAMLYGTESWTVKNHHENKISLAEMRMFCWMCGKTRQDKIRNANHRERIGVALIVERWWKPDLDGLSMWREDL
jgi:hypothetical protein